MNKENKNFVEKVFDREFSTKDARAIWNYWQKNNFEIDEKNESLTDVHFEPTFRDMINWQYEDIEPFEMLDVSSNLKKHKEYLYLPDEDEYIFFYAMA